MAYLIGVLIVLVVLLLSIGLHEIGHMVPAKRFGVRVSHYMVGFGPTLWSRPRVRPSTASRRSRSAAMSGWSACTRRTPRSGDPPARTRGPAGCRRRPQASAEEIRARRGLPAFYHLSTPKKLVVMLGGPVMNLSSRRPPDDPARRLRRARARAPRSSGVAVRHPGDAAAATAECTPADEAAPGRRRRPRARRHVVSFDGTAIDVLGPAVGAHPVHRRGAVPIVVERDGETLDLTVTPVVADRPVYDENGEAVLGRGRRARHRARRVPRHPPATSTSGSRC